MRAGIRMDQKTKSNPRARGFIRIRKKDSPENLNPHKNGVGTLWPNLNRLSRFVPCGKGDFTFTVKPGTL